MAEVAGSRRSPGPVTCSHRCGVLGPQMVVTSLCTNRLGMLLAHGAAAAVTHFLVQICWLVYGESSMFAAALLLPALPLLPISVRLSWVFGTLFETPCQVGATWCQAPTRPGKAACRRV